MGVIIESFLMSDPDLFSGQPVTWTYGQIEDRFDIIIDFRVEAFSIDVDDEQDITARPAVSTEIPDTTNLLSADFLAFEDFLVLDSIEIIGTSFNDGTYQILEKIDEDNLILDSALTFEEFPNGAYIQLVTPIRGIRYRWNFVGNEDPTNFNSAINGEEQRYDTAFADALVGFPVVLDPKGKNEYKFGNATIEGRGISGGSQLFRIIHTGMILPSFLAGQYNDLKNGILPPWYLNGNCLKHVVEIEANHELADPNRVQTVLQDQKLGNTGGYGESFNGGVTKYSVSNKQIERISDSAILNQVDLESPCTVTFDIDNSTAVFADGLTNSHLKFTYLPSQAAFYQNTGGKNYVESFIQDRAVVLAGANGPGANFGTDQQAITDFAVVFVNANKLTCTATIDVAAATQNILLGRDKPQYRLMVTTANHAVAYEQSDKSTLIVDVNEFLVQLTNIDLVKTLEASFIQHPYNDSLITEALTAFPTDDIVSEQQFYIDFTNKENDGITIKSITTEIVAKSGGDPDIVLESTLLDTSNFPLVDGLVQEIAIVQDRGYKIPEEIRKFISIQRNSAADVGLIKNWIVQYGFMHRWDEWNEVLGITNPVDGIYDPALPFNGFNHDWLRYTTIAGYKLNARHTFVIEQNGINFTQTFDFPFNSMDFHSNPNWISELIEIWDTSYGLPGFQNANFGIQFMRGDRDSPVKLYFTWDGVAPAPLESEVTMVFWIGITNGTDPQNIYRASSAHDKSANSWIIEDKIIVTKTGDDYVGECTLDHTKLPPGERFISAYARIYEPIVPPPVDAKLMSPDDVPKTDTTTAFKTTAP